MHKSTSRPRASNKSGSSWPEQDNTNWRSGSQNNNTYFGKKSTKNLSLTTTNSSTKATPIELTIKNWVNKNKQSLTFKDITNQFSLYNNDESTKFYIISQLIKHVSNNDNIITILEKIHTDKLWPKFEKSKQTNSYGLFHMASYVESGCNYQIFTRLVKLLYTCGYTPFMTNEKVCDDDHETALMGLFQPNNRLNEDERLERYNIYLNNIPENSISKILNGYLNKTIEKAVDITRFFLCINPEQTLETIAKNFLIKEYKDINLGTINPTIESNVDFMMSVLSGIDDNYKYVQIQDKSLQTFFKMGEYKCLSMDKLFDIFHTKMNNIITTSKNENTRRNEIVFIRMLGSFANKGKYLNECRALIFDHFFEDDNIEDLIHMVCHIGYVTQEIKDRMLSFDTGELKIEFALINIFDKTNTQHKNNMTQVIVAHDHLGLYRHEIDLEKIEFVKKIQCKKIPNNISYSDLNIRDLLNQIKITYELYPNDIALITQQILFTIMDNTTLYNRNGILQLITMLMKDQYMDTQSIRTSANYIMRQIKSGNLDSSPDLCVDTWTAILSSL